MFEISADCIFVYSTEIVGEYECLSLFFHVNYKNVLWFMNVICLYQDIFVMLLP